MTDKQPDTLRAALAAQAPQPTNTKTHDLLSTMIGMFLGFKEKIGYKPGSVIDKVVAEAVEHLKDWPYPEPAPKAPQQAAFQGRVTRHSDQSVLVSFPSCRLASEFERSMQASAAFNAARKEGK